MVSWFKNAKKEINTNLFNKYPELINTENTEIFLTGKNIVESKLKKYLDKNEGRDKINKGDIFLLYKNKETIIFLGFSIKKSPHDTLLNWSIEEQFKKLKNSEYKTLKDVKETFLLNIGIDLKNRKSHKKYREQFNKAMKGANLYKNCIKTIIKMNEKHLLRELIRGIGSTTSYPTYLFD